MIAPSLTRVRRAPGTVQLGLDPTRALLLTGIDRRVEPLLAGYDGRADLGTTLADTGVDPREHRRLLGLLTQAGALVDSTTLVPPPGADPLDDARRAPDRASAALLAGTDRGGRDVMADRSQAWVEVRGAGRVGSTVGALLAAAGIGHLSVDDPAPLRPADLPAGAPLTDLGRPRAVAAEQAAARSAPGLRNEPPAGAAAPDLVVLAPVSGLARGVAQHLLASEQPHLLALVLDTTGVVGPLVRPGRSSCLRCHDLHRADRDPGWPQVVIQADEPAGTVAACDVTLAALVAAQAAQQALAYLDGWPVATHDATLETALPTGVTRRRTWSPHPACGCRWDADLRPSG